MNVITVNNVSKKFGSKELFKNLNLKVEEGDFIAITGGSGSGKTTLMNMIGFIEPCDRGTIDMFEYKHILTNSKQAELVIRNYIGYLFQNYALIDEETVEENLQIGLKYRKVKKNEGKKLIADSLQQVGLQGYEKRKIFELSGGEQQRIAIARIMLKPSKIILADEPTGSLDEENRELILNLLKKINESGKTIIIVSHDPYIAKQCKKVIHLK